MYAIAGATGRVGSVTAQILLNAGVDVRVLVRRKSDAEVLLQSWGSRKTGVE